MNDQINNEKSLMKYAKTGNLNGIKILFENGADICAQDNMAICWASLYGHLEVVKFLFENGADIYTQNNYVIRHAAFGKQLNKIGFE